MTDTDFTPRDFRDALSCFATGVTIVTTAGPDGEPVGMTASSFNSVSMDPPLVLWSVGKSALSAPVFEHADHFSIHILASQQTDLSNRFARSGEDKFAGVNYVCDANGVPQIADVLVRFDCKTDAVHPGGDHLIIVGEVQAITHGEGAGLVFSNGSYATALAMRPPTMASDAAKAAALDAGDPIENLLIYNLSRASTQLSSQLHKAVEASGLSVAEWRMLASLHNNARRTLDDLVVRTFVDPEGIEDMLVEMQQAGLCKVEGAGADRIVCGTQKGHSRVAHLFAMGEQLEVDALRGEADDARKDLNGLLQSVIRNTDNQ